MAPPPLPLEIWQAICEQIWLADRHGDIITFCAYNTLVNVRATNKKLASAAEMYMFRTLPAPEMKARCPQAGVPWALICKEITSGHVKSFVQNLYIELFSQGLMGDLEMKNFAAVQLLMKSLPKLRKFTFFAMLQPHLELQFACSGLSSLDLSNVIVVAKELCEVIRANSGLVDICLGDHLWLSSGEWKDVFAALIEAQLTKLEMFDLGYDNGHYLYMDPYASAGQDASDGPSVLQSCYQSFVLCSACSYDYHALRDLMTRHKAACKATSLQEELGEVFMDFCSLAEARADPSKVGKEMARQSDD